MWPTGLHATITRKATSKRFGELPMKFFLILFIIVAPRIWVKSTKVVNKLKSVQIFITLHTLPFNPFMYFSSRLFSCQLKRWHPQLASLKQAHRSAMPKEQPQEYPVTVEVGEKRYTGFYIVRYGIVSFAAH